jgi:type 2 lantibiotic biosynthesis protein LanM
MEQGDVPFFTAYPCRDALIVAPGQEIEGSFLEPSLKRVLCRLEDLGEEDPEQQVAYIEGSLYAYSARDAKVAPRPAPAADGDDGMAGPPSREAFVEPALALAKTIRARAIRAEDGSATWISPQYLVQADRYQLQPMGYDLYGGTCGVSLFLAAAEQFSPRDGYGELALAAIRPLRGALRERPERLARTMDIGGGSGLGSVVYSLVRVSHLLDESSLLEDARRAGDLITEERIAADESLDVLAGAAGAILGLVTLYEAQPDPEILERAIACGAHLTDARTASEAGPRAWATVRGVLTTGFSHGAAGIAYALLRLYEHTQDQRLLEAAQEGIAYEDTTYSPEIGNWAAYRKHDEPSYAWQWCYGAPGIGLARLGSLRILNTRQVREDIELALRATREIELQPVDRLCCGNMGRTEVLLAAGERFLRPELSETARAHVWRVVTRAELAGGFVPDPLLPRQVHSPGFFRGTAGIGYELLRMAHPEQLPSVLMWE